MDEQWRVNSWLPLITPHTERYRSLCGVGVDASSFSFRGHHGHGKIKRGIVWISRKGVHLRPIGCVRLEQLHLKSSLSASAYVRPACATDPRQYVSAHPIKATGFVERYCFRKVGAGGTASLGCRQSCVWRQPAQAFGLHCYWKAAVRLPPISGHTERLK